MKTKALGTFLLLFLLASPLFSQSSIKPIFQPKGISLFSQVGLTAGLGYEWRKGRHLINADLAGSFTLGLYLGCGQGASSLNARTSYNYRLFGSSFMMFWNLGTGASIYNDSNSECGQGESHIHPNLNTGFLLKARLTKEDAVHPIHLNFNLSLDAGPGFRKARYREGYSEVGLILVPVSYLSLSIDLGKRTGDSESE